nr:autotransporter domain-containing protein [Acinetobacter sp. Marseille-Q1620]
MKLSTLTLSFLSLLYANTSMALVDIDQTKESIKKQRNQWFFHLSENVVTQIPEQGSKIAEWDRQVSNEYKKISGERRKLAEADKNQSHAYVYDSFVEKIFGKNTTNVDLEHDQSFNKIIALYKDATYAYDEKTKKTRSIDFILKDRFGRGRPYQVIDKNGEYLKDYTDIVGSSFPSGHTFNGFREAVPLAMLFPEKGSDIFARAVEYGESRVIVGAHFGTDTIASRVLNYHTMAQILADDDLSKMFVHLARDTRKNIANVCQNNIKNCLESSTDSQYKEETGYYAKKDPSQAVRILPNEMPHSAAYLLRLRFPYLSSAQWQSILASTAYPGNSLAGWNIKKDDPDSYWGVINLPKAYNGPSYFYDTFVVNQNKNNQSYDLAGFTEWDVWKNDISGSGKLIKNGDGILTLAGNDSFAGVEVNQGTLMIAGNSHYLEKSAVNGGTLAVQGTLNSAVDVNSNGTLALMAGKIDSAVSVNNQGILVGNGHIAKLRINAGGTVSPDASSIGTLTILDNVTFDKNSNYHVNISPDGRSDFIQSLGSATLNGGSIKVSLESAKNLLSEKEVRSLTGSKYKILTAEKAITGKFDLTEPNYMFVGTRLDYDQNQILLNIGRNDKPFASVAKTDNEKAVAIAVDRLVQGHPVFESILKSRSEHDARQAFQALTGQIHSDIASDQINTSRLFTEAWNNQLRLQQPEKDNQATSWLRLVRNWERSSTDQNASGYHATTDGVYFGLDTPLINDALKLGVASGYTHSSLSGNHASASSDNYHLGLYAGMQLENFALRTGASHIWHRIDTSRSVNYDVQSDRNTAKYDAHSNQVFTEAAYTIKTDKVNFEPFAHVTYINFDRNNIREHGGAASLSGKKQYIDTTLSTVGLRAESSFKVSDLSDIQLRGELGWQHYYDDLDRVTRLNFGTDHASFLVKSVPVSRDGMLIKVSSDMVVNKNMQVSLGYEGLVSDHYKDNSVNAHLIWKF